jgi:hypothetical protein
VAVLAAAAFIAFASSAPTPALPKKPAFPPGSWKGNAFLSGSISKQGIFATGSGPIAFVVSVEANGKAGGALDFQVVGSSKVDVGGVTGSGKLTMSGTLDLGGTGSRVTFSGPVHVSGTVTANGLTVPVNFTAPAGGGFSPRSVTCTQVTGDLAVEGRQAQQAAGFATTVKAPFVAVRYAAAGGDEGLPEQLAAEYEALLARIAEAAKGNPTAEEIRQLAADIEALDAAMLGAAACGDPPPGFEKGIVAQDTFLARLSDLLAAVVLNADAYTTQDVISLLATAIRIGAVGAAAPDQASSKALLESFADILNGKLDEAIASANTDSIFDIYVWATQAGLTELAAEAWEALGG